MLKKILFRADGNEEIGYGHVIRSLALADMLKDDFECIFVTRFLNDFLENEINKICNTCVLLSNNGIEHLNEFKNMLNGDEIVVLDNYFFTTDYQIQIRSKKVILACIDDLGDKHFVSDLIINHIDISPYKTYSKESHTKLILGIENALLRKEFFELKQLSSEKENSLLLAFGGVDFNNLTYKYLTILIKSKLNVTIDVIINKKNEKFKEIFEEASNNYNVNVYFDLSANEVRSLMLKSKTAILPSSTMCIEGITSGINIVSGYYVNNQKYAYLYFMNNGFITGMGDLNDIQEKLLIKQVEMNLKKINENDKIIDRINSSKVNYIKIFKSFSNVN
tara:strand:+ start:315 stop:1319 length:1005 start_codon:yes stop_codon:yes gene_type:complete